MTDLPLEKLRELRSCNAPIVRGNIPVIGFNENYLVEKIVVSILIFVASIFIIGNLIGHILNFITFGLLEKRWLFWLLIDAAAGIFPVSIYLFWPVYYVRYIEYKTKQKPTEEILTRFGNRYKSLKEYMRKNGFVTIIEKPVAEEPTHKAIPVETNNFRLWLGTTTGQLVNLWHKSGMAKEQQVALNLEEVCQNILVLGGIGSGKTTCVMQPLLLQCLDQKCGGLIFDIKGDVKHAVVEFAAATKRNLILLGPNSHKINLLDGLTPEVAASFLKSAFLLNGKGPSDSFWVDTAAELCRNTLGLLSFLPNHYTLQALYQYLFDHDSRDIIDGEISAILPELDNTQSRLLKTYQRYHETIFSQFDAKIRSGVNATVAQALSPFNHPALLDAFCSTENTMVKMEALLDGTICLVDMPLSVWGLGGKVAYTFIKLRFFNLMQNRNQLQVNQDSPVFFMCDEFQEIVSANREGLSDLNFWDKSRSSKTAGIISSQSIASFYAALGSHDMANALLQNFRQKLCLRTEDPTTINFMENLIGRARVKKLSITQNQQYYSNTISDAREGVVDAQLFRELSPAQAVAILSIAGQSMDDVLTLLPIYAD